MLSTQDQVVRVEWAKRACDVVFHPTDWSLVAVPGEVEQASKLFQGLYNSSTARHICLTVNRLRRKDRFEGLAGIAAAGPVGWSYFETIDLVYESPYSSSNNALLPISEPGHLLVKGQAPDTARTKWFSADEKDPNASTFWNIATQEQEGLEHSFCQRFSWEVHMLLMSMVGPAAHKRFTLACPLSQNELAGIFGFCSRFGYGVDIITEDPAMPKMIMDRYDQYLNPEKKDAKV